MIKAELSLPIDLSPPAGLVRVREDRVAGIAEYVFCAGVGPDHARALSAEVRALNHARRRALEADLPVVTSAGLA